jgi:recombination protein RecT
MASELTQQPKTFRDLITQDSYKAQIAAALPRGLTADRMIRVVLTAINRQPKLLNCTKESLWQSVIDSASLGLFPDALGRSYLVPYGEKCQLIIGYKGLIDLMYRSDRINLIQTGVVHKGDAWNYQRGMVPKLEHAPCDQPGQWTHVYSIVHLKGCEMPSVEVMTRAEVMAIKARSRASTSGPWVTDEEAMAVKSCIRRHSKVLPMSAEVAQAMEFDGDQIDPTIPPKTTSFSDDISARTTDAVVVEKEEAKP